ncbi:threonine/serine dehydratase [Actinomadura rupiterrae]|uniref:threonine/serine dehydratase n=1 Tax=Actinomadura rupiterrae TaxID=559627 RepID=UPI0020A2DE8C|nr:threonine/serine dehydratase [Actinomadura rupiterrae]MCP2336827.1 threonine dehydratase [Actinomadura rupiterrae]
MIEKSDVRAAAARIAGHVRRTPVLESDAFGAPVWLKLEQTQHSGSFKARGAFNRLLTAIEDGTLPASGVVTASGGNAGLGVAYAASTLDVPARVFLPRNAPEVKVAKLSALGADVRPVGDKYADAQEAALKDAADTGALLCHAYDQPEVCAGQGTIGLELLEQTGGAFDTALIVVGGGGLMAGIATALDGEAKVVAVEPERCPTLHTALEQGEPATVAVSGVASDSLGASRIGEIAFAVARRTGVGSVLVPDEAIVEARRALWERHRLVAEHGTAAALAALLSGAYKPAPDERIAIVVCGANTDPSDLVRP